MAEKDLVNRKALKALLTRGKTRANHGAWGRPGGRRPRRRKGRNAGRK